MKKQLSTSTLVAASLMLLFLSGSLLANAAADISVSDAYIRATAPGQVNGTAFMKLHNGSMQTYSLVDAEGDAAKAVELHTHINVNGMMKMRRIDKIDLPAHSEVVLKSGGHHVMLIGLKQMAKEGNSIHLSLVFNDGSKKMINVPVKKMSMQMGSTDHQHNMHKPMAEKMEQDHSDHSMH